MKKILLITLLVSTVFCTNAQVNNLSSILDEMASKYYLPSIRVVLGTFTYEDSDLPTPFASFFKDELKFAASSSKKMQILDRNAASALDPLLRPQYEDFFKETGTEAILYGTYYLEDKNVRIKLSLTDLNSATLIAVSDCSLACSLIPDHVSIKPQLKEYDRAKELFKLGIETKSDFSVTISTEKGKNASYRDGDYLSAMLSVSKDAFVRIYHVDSYGQIQLIWPNRFGGNDGFVKSGEIIKIPSDNDPFKFYMEAPYGTEYLKAVASTVAFNDTIDDFADLGTNSRSVMTRGLKLVDANKTKVQYAEALATYNVSK